jgi:prevent-host-death family protein
MVAAKDQKTLPAGEFKATCLRVMEEVATYRRSVVITKHGKPVVRIVPIEPEPERDVFGCLAGEMEIVGDIESPVVPPKAWKALR